MKIYTEIKYPETSINSQKDVTEAAERLCVHNIHSIFFFLKTKRQKSRRKYADTFVQHLFKTSSDSRRSFHKEIT